MKPKVDLDGMTLKERRVALEYFMNPSASKVAPLVGLTPAAVTAIVQRPAVKAFLEKRQLAAEERADLSIEALERALAEIVHFDLGKCFGPDGQMLPLHQMPPEVRRALAGVETMEHFNHDAGVATLDGYVRKVKSFGKVEAIKLALQRRGALVEKREDTVRVVQVNVGVRRAEVQGRPAAPALPSAGEVVDAQSEEIPGPQSPGNPQDDEGDEG